MASGITLRTFCSFFNLGEGIGRLSDNGNFELIILNGTGLREK